MSMALRRPISKVLTLAGVLISACAIAVAPSVKAPAPRAPEVVLGAQTTPITQQLALQQTDLPRAFVTKFLVLPSAGKPFPTPQFPPQVAPTSLGSVIINTYNIVEPWVRWGFDVAAYAVGWIPYVGVDTVNSFIQLGIDQWNFWLGWALPPLPPIFPLAAQQAPLAAAELADAPESPVVTTPSPLRNLVKVIARLLPAQQPVKQPASVVAAPKTEEVVIASEVADPSPSANGVESVTAEATPNVRANGDTADNPLAGPKKSA
jgi:hypothetical protein